MIEKKIIETPLFPSYVFVNIKDNTDFHRSLALKGFVRFIKFENQLALINESVINNIKIVTRGGDDIEVAVNNFHPGQQLVIGNGPFTGLNCEMIKYKGKDKAVIRIMF